MDYYTENENWLQARKPKNPPVPEETTHLLLVLHTFINAMQTLQQRELAQFKHARRTIAHASGPLFTAQTVAAQSQQRLRVIVPALRYARTLRTHLHNGLTTQNPCRLHQFLLAKVAGCSPEHLCSEPPADYVSKTYPVALEQNTALGILTQHADVFGTLPSWVGPVSAYIVPGPYTMTLKRLMEEQAKRFFFAAKDQLKGRIQRELKLSPEELAVLQRM